MKSMDKAALAENNGQDGKPAYVAFDGKVYDVSDSAKWKNGKHMMRHSSGMDLTSTMDAAPHGPEVFEKFSKVADLADAGDEPEGPELFWPLNRLFAKVPMLKRHPHPFSVHFPIALYLAGFLFVLLYYIFKVDSFAATSFHLTVLATITTPVVLLTGIQSWWLFYGLKRTVRLTAKFLLAPVVLILGIVACVIYAMLPGPLAESGGSGLAYSIILGIDCALVLLLGYIGAMFTFPE